MASPVALVRKLSPHGAGGFAHDEFRLDDVFLVEFEAGTVDAPEEDLGSGAAHLAQGLADGGQGRVLVGGALDIVKADDGNIFGDVQAGLAQGANGAHGGNVVEGKQGGEGLGGGEEGLGGDVSELGGRGITLELGHETEVDGQAELAGDTLDVGPADRGVRTEFLSFNKGDLAVAKVIQVLEGDFGSAVMVQNNVDDAADVVVAGNSDDGDREVEVPGRVDGNEAVDGTLEKHAGVFVDEVGAMAVAGDEVEVALLEEIVFEAAHDRGGVAVADLGNDNADGEAALGAQGTGEKIRTVLELAGGGENAILGLLGDGIGDVGTIDDERNGGGRKAEVIGQFFEAYRLLGSAGSGMIAR